MGGIQEKRWWPFSEVAKAVGLMAAYEAQYSTLSKATHNTPTGLASKTDHRIRARSVLNLLNDTVEACAALVFFQIPGEGSPRPLTRKWNELVEPIAGLKTEYAGLSTRLDDLLEQEFAS